MGAESTDPIEVADLESRVTLFRTLWRLSRNVPVHRRQSVSARQREKKIVCQLEQEVRRVRPALFHLEQFADVIV
jgi:hypothetical protein